MSDLRFYAPGFEIRVKGERLAERGFIVNQVTVEQATEAAARATFSVFRAGTEQSLSAWLKEGLSFFKLGVPVEIRAGYGGERRLIFKGCLTSFSYTFAVDSIGEIQVEAQDFLFLLMKSRALAQKQGGFNQVYDHEVVRRVLSHYPAFEEVYIEETPIKYPKVQQKDEESDYQFLKRLAERNNYLLYARVDQEREKAVFCFKKPQDKPTPRQGQHELYFGRELRSFTPNFSLTQVITRVVVRGWDPKQKKEIEGQAELSAKDQERFEKTGFPSPITLELHLPVRSKEEAQKQAEAICQKYRRLLEAEGEALGLPEIQAGDLIEIKGLPQCQGPADLDLCRSYLAVQATHQIGEGGYRLRLKLKEVISYP